MKVEYLLNALNALTREQLYQVNEFVDAMVERQDAPELRSGYEGMTDPMKNAVYLLAKSRGIGLDALV